MTGCCVLPLASAHEPGLSKACEAFALVMRVAKIVCAEGEVICLVRNLSRMGANLRYFHGIPADEVVELVMANGSSQAMHRLWQDGEQAGYRFAESVEVKRLLDDPGSNGRPEIRITLDRAATISARGAELRTRLLDLSQSGAQIECDVPLAVRQLVHLGIDGSTPYMGHVRWRKGQRHGLVFQRSLGLAELATIAAKKAECAQPSNMEFGLRTAIM